ncbi:glycosyltransferase family 2 protein [Meridianimarinicoccus roseus]|uniref:glycosyltransferase family 2 protein n=1 Tax=Meridianimarinicoccus roseus TaxID=2072018 RepID=UPI001EE66F8C|nr:glycosyltransferase [Meridianimarinicoccus roseus]
MSEGRVSVVIPLYNHADYIRQAVRSVLEQGALVQELIVIDDGSKDSSASIMRELAAGDDRIRFLTQENSGAHATINRGLEMAEAEFVTVLNSDDYYAPGRFAALIRALDLDAGADIAGSGIGFVDGDGQQIENPWLNDAIDNYKRKRNLGLALMDYNFLMTTSNFFMRRSLLDRIGNFSPLRYTHDMEFALRCAARRVRLCFLDRPLMMYRFHGANTISEDHAKVRVEWALSAAVYIHLAQMGSHPVPDDQVARCHEVLDRHGLLRAARYAVDELRTRGADRVTDTLITDTGFIDGMKALV